MKLTCGLYPENASCLFMDLSYQIFSGLSSDASFITHKTCVCFSAFSSR